MNEQSMKEFNNFIKSLSEEDKQLELVRIYEYMTDNKKEA